MSLFKKSFSARVILSLFVILSLSAFAPMSQTDPGSVLDNILKIIASFATLAGFSALIAVLVAIGVRLNLIPEERVGQITAVMNIIVFVILVALGIFRPDLSLEFLDSIAAKLAAIALFILGLLTQLIVPGYVLRSLHLARVPVLGLMGDAETLVPPHYTNWTNPPQA